MQDLLCAQQIALIRTEDKNRKQKGALPTAFRCYLIISSEDVDLKIRPGITLSLQDLDYTTKNGYIEGMSNILTKQLEDLSPTDRPIHSTDEKRLKFMVKKKEGWVKDDGSQISKAVTNTKFKLVNTLTEWEKENPDYNNNPKKLDTWQKSLSAISPEPSIKEKCDKAIKKKLAKLASIKEAMNSVKE